MTNMFPMFPQIMQRMKAAISTTCIAVGFPLEPVESGAVWFRVELGNAVETGSDILVDAIWFSKDVEIVVRSTSATEPTEIEVVVIVVVAVSNGDVDADDSDLDIWDQDNALVTKGLVTRH